MPPLFYLQEADSPIIANLPHSGTHVPPTVAEQFTAAHLISLPNTDWHLDKLYSFLPALGVTVLGANYSRYVIDLNRKLSHPLIGPFKRAPVAKTTGLGWKIYKTLPSQSDLQKRVDAYYSPYHEQLQKLITKIKSRFGKCYLIDLHSFYGPATQDILLGDAKGQANAETLLPAATRRFKEAGFDVAVNHIYTGGHITKHYGKQANIEAMIVEARYTTYLNKGGKPLKHGELRQLEPPSADVPELKTAQARFKAVFKRLVRDLS